MLGTPGLPDGGPRRASQNERRPVGEADTGEAAVVSDAAWGPSLACRADGCPGADPAKIGWDDSVVRWDGDRCNDVSLGARNVGGGSLVTPCTRPWGEVLARLAEDGSSDTVNVGGNADGSFNHEVG